MIERLTADRGMKNNTKRAYHSAYLDFTRFNLSLDDMPELLDDQLAMYVAFRIEKGDASGTIKSKLSGIKSMLELDSIEINTRTVRLRALIKACKYKNDRVYQRFPINESLLARVIKHIDQIFHNQPYSAKLYKSIVVMGYYGMMRIGELATGDHPVLARDVHFNHASRKVQVILRTSKTHGLGDQPQYIKFSDADAHVYLYNKKFSPYSVVMEYLLTRGDKKSDSDPFYVFADNSPVKPHQVQAVLKRALTRLGINAQDFGFHSLRIGHATTLDHRHVSLDVIRRKGRWKSNIIYRYIRSLK